MANKILIAPVGVYQQRVWKSIVRSGADKIYLISDKKPEYGITRSVASDLERQVNINLIAKVVKKEADFSWPEDIYRVLVGIIERERVENPYVRIVLDVTSTTKEAWLVASNLANSYGLTISYVPGATKISKEIAKKRYEMEKDDPGGEIKEILPALSILKGSPLDKDEIRVLYKMSGKHYESATELIGELAKEEDIDSVSGAYKKRFLRVLRDLEEKRLIRSEERGRTKLIKLTDVGEGIISGIKDADEDLKRNGLKPLIESLYT